MNTKFLILFLFLCCLSLLWAEGLDPKLSFEKDGKIYPVTIETASKFLNPITEEEEALFMEKASHTIVPMADSKMAGGSTQGEREKELYPKAMFKVLAGRVDEGMGMLQLPQKYDPKEHHAYTDGFDLWWGFTVKGQVRKYFHFGHLMKPKYKADFEKAFAKWTQTDPRNTPHPVYKKYNPKKQGWTPERFGNRQVDGRRTDNLYAMTNVATYLFAEAAGNEKTRQVAWDRIRDYGVTMYRNGIGEWDSENYLSHTMSAYINLFDFAEDEMVKMHAKGMLDWISMAMAVKYWRGGWAGAVKRDYGNIQVLKGNALVCAHLYFDNLGLPCKGDRDDVHHMTSAYRPPAAVRALARGEIDLPVEIFISHPTYENWKAKDGRSGRDLPEFFETFFIGHTYRFGSLPYGNGGDVSGFKMITHNSEKGVDYLCIGHNLSKELKKFEKGKKKGKARALSRSKFLTTDTPSTNVAQYRNLAIYLSAQGDAPFYLMHAPGAEVLENGNQRFIRHEKTWIALTGIGLEWKGRHDLASDMFGKAGDVLHAKGQGKGHCGFAMEIGEEKTHGSFEAFVKAVSSKAKLEGKAGTWTYSASDGASLGIVHSASKKGLFESAPDQPWILKRVRSADEVLAQYPKVTRNGKLHLWKSHFPQYRTPDGPGPIDLGFQEGKLVVKAGGHTFTGEMNRDGLYRFTNR